MFSTINFLFLLSLGFISWIILCYIQQIKQIHPNIRNSPIVIMNETPASKISTPSEPHEMVNDPIRHDKYDLYVSFLGIFVCIYALAKITHIAEMYMAKRLRHKIYVSTTNDGEDISMDSLSELQEEQENLKCKLNKLEKQNQIIKFELEKVIHIKSHLHPDHKDNIRSIFITNKQIHLNRQIYVNQEEDHNNNNIEYKESKTENGDSNDIWEKYWQMQKTAFRKPISSKNGGELIAPMPVVMTSQELQTLRVPFKD